MNIQGALVRAVAVFSGAQQKLQAKRNVLMLLALLAIVGANAVFAQRQRPTPEKLSFTAISGGAEWAVSALNTSISGDVVIPASHNGIPVTAIREWLGNKQGAFEGCRNITSVVIPHSVTVIARGAFYNCPNLRSAVIGDGVTLVDYDAFNYCAALTSVTFEGTVGNIDTRTPFPGDLRAKHQAGGAGTYTRTNGGNVWTKAGRAHAPDAYANDSPLNGVWEETSGSGRVVTINGSTATLNSVKDTRPIIRDAISKGYWGIGSTHWRNISSTGNLRWSGQWVVFTHNTSNPNVATGTSWASGTWTLTPDGQTLVVGDARSSSTWTKLR